MAERITIPLLNEDVKLLKKQAAKEGRTFSGYMQKVFGGHIAKQKGGIPETKTGSGKITPKKRKVVIRRKK